MLRVRLLHWKSQEATGHIVILKGAGYRVEYHQQFSSALLKSWREAPPDAFVIDLSRLPSQGREIAIALRQSPRTRRVPIVFCGGLYEKVQAVRAVLPDAAYCELPALAVTLQNALKNPLPNPLRPGAMMDRYQGRTTVQKLGITQSSVVLVLNAPTNALQILGELPSGAEVVEVWTPQVNVTLCFLHAADSVAETLSELRAHAGGNKLWMLWRKGAKAARCAVTGDLVRENALPLGLVDYKVCSVDAIWTAMLFVLKR